VEVPQVHVQEVLKHVPKLQVQEVIREVPKHEVRYQEKVVEVPQIHYVDKVVEVPQVHVQEVVKEVPKIQTQEIVRTVPKVEVQVREKIIDVPCVQVVERTVELPEIHVQEVPKHVPKVVEVQELVRNIQRVDWDGERAVDVTTEGPSLSPSPTSSSATNLMFTSGERSTLHPLTSRQDLSGHQASASTLPLGTMGTMTPMASRSSVEVPVETTSRRPREELSGLLAGIVEAPPIQPRPRPQGSVGRVPVQVETTPPRTASSVQTQSPTGHFPGQRFF